MCSSRQTSPYGTVVSHSSLSLSLYRQQFLPSSLVLPEVCLISNNYVKRRNEDRQLLAARAARRQALLSARRFGMNASVHVLVVVSRRDCTSIRSFKIRLNAVENVCSSHTHHNDGEMSACSPTASWPLLTSHVHARDGRLDVFD